MALIICGTVSYMGISLYEENKERKKKKLRELRIVNTGLTDYELQPIDKQDLNYEEAMAYFNSARNT